MGSLHVAVNQNYGDMIMNTTATSIPRFLRKTTLADDEYRRNFRQIDNDVIAVITSPEADAITPLMSKIYLRLVSAPENYWERQGVLRFAAEAGEGKRRTAWQALCNLLNVSSSTANKALTWLGAVGVIGYFSGKNGVGIRVFLNRASASVGIKPQTATKKILPFSLAPSGKAGASAAEAAFNGSFVQEDLEPNDNSRPPDGGAGQERPNSHPPGPKRFARSAANRDIPPSDASTAPVNACFAVLVREIVAEVRPQIEATIQSAAKQAAFQEHKKTREWLEKAGLPKVARVAQREAYNILRQQGVTINSSVRARSQLQVGAGSQITRGPKPLSPAEIAETVEFCIFRLQNCGQAIDVTLAEISAEGGGYLLADDAPTVRELAEARAQLPQTTGANNGV